MRSVLAYTAARLAIFAATFAVLYLLPVLDHSKPESMLLILALSVIISGVVSYVLLTGLRDAVSSAVVTGIGKRRHKFEESRSKED
ncbi:Protein of unknown function [Thermomonospora echinospora]|uniref:DUF4229 domain-containing protein n=1 Tax=Thermomonospora echinospora TaxID=1992 RepID=A0A1H5YZP4_9ACTN|nr:DUF4229 domain-containing protein [Thermomonospora echinospora]SEG29789.1 Protein of unknown function [Thermomonospora echinospora]